MASTPSDSDLADALRTHGLSLRRRRILELMAPLEFEGEAGGGKVRVVLDGAGNMLSVAIDPGLLAPSSAQAVGELVVAATRLARLQRDAARRHALVQAGLDPQGDD